MDKFLEMLQAYEAWVEASAAIFGIPVPKVKELVEEEVMKGACIGCSEIETCVARLYILEREKGEDRP